jgi:hypothetical protein
MDTIYHPRIVVRRMTRAEWFGCLVELTEAVVERHGPLTFSALQERVNQAILEYGIDKAAAAVREAPQ